MSKGDKRRPEDKKKINANCSVMNVESTEFDSNFFDIIVASNSLFYCINI